MLNLVEEFLNSQEEAFAECEDFLPRMEKIKEADKIGREVLNFIDDNIKNIDMEAFDSLDIPKIVDDLNLEINEELDGDVLSDIYNEIDSSFREGGRVSLEDYLAQGNVIFADMLNELKGTVDYSIEYSEKQLKEEEKKAFDRFNLVMSMQNLREMAFCFEFSEKGQNFLDKSNRYLNAIDEAPFAGTVEEKIAELNNSILLVAAVTTELDCKVVDSIELNNFFSDKVNDLVADFDKYREDINIREMFDNLKQTIANYKDNEFVNIIEEKIEKIDEKIFENIREQEKVSDRQLE